MADFGNSAAATAAQNSLNQSQAFAAALQRAKQVIEWQEVPHLRNCKGEDILLELVFIYDLF